MCDIPEYALVLLILRVWINSLMKNISGHSFDKLLISFDNIGYDMNVETTTLEALSYVDWLIALVQKKKSWRICCDI